MFEVTTCPSCQRDLRLPDELVGQKVRCPQCAASFTALPPAPPPPARTDAYKRRHPHRRLHGYDYDDDYDYYDRLAQPTYMPHRGAAILTLGILSLAVCGILGPVAWIMGQNDLREMRNGRMDPSGEGLTSAGRICGIISTCFMGAIALFYGIVFLVMAAVGVGMFG